MTAGGASRGAERALVLIRLMSDYWTTTSLRACAASGATAHTQTIAATVADNKTLARFASRR
jgi:hypothetical protein